MPNFLKFLVAITTLSQLVIASSAVSNEYKSHLHGQAELTIAFEQKRVEVNLITPADTLFGFEHVASSPDELTQVALSKKYLSKLNNIMKFNDGKCQVNKVDIDLGVNGVNDHHHAHQHEKTNLHSEVEVNFQLNCQSPKSITAASVTLFEQYPSLKKVHVMWLRYAQQGAAIITPEKTRIAFSE